MIGFFIVIEMAHQERDPVVRRMDLGCKRSRLFHGQADPVLAGSDVKRATAAPLTGRNESIPFGHFDHAVYDGLRINFCEGWRRSRV
jgi:hypothetical protein